MAEPAPSSSSGSSAAAAADAGVDHAAAQLAGLSVSDGSFPGVRVKGRGVTLESLAARIARGEIKKIVVLTGAGISCSAGIPDFRTPGTGLYDNLQKYALPRPTAVFELSYFRNNPAPFYLLARELYPDGSQFRPTPTHFFIKALQERGVLLRNLTQNIDGLESLAGLASDKLVQAHGGFGGAKCIDCHASYPESFVREAVFAELQRIPSCTRPNCVGLVKPNIVFFGESLPKEFFTSLQRDLPQADLLVVMGTSLTVQPFASLIERVGKNCPRVLINMHSAGEADGTGADSSDEDDDNEEEDEESEEKILARAPLWSQLQRQLKEASSSSERQALEAKMAALRQVVLQLHHARNNNESRGGFDFHRRGGRDLFVQGECDAGVRAFARLIGADFAKRLEELVREDALAHPKATADKHLPSQEEAKKIAEAIAGAAGATKPVESAAAAPRSAPASAPTGATKLTESVAAAPSSAAASAPSGSSDPSAVSNAAIAADAASKLQPPFAVGFDFDHTLGLDHGLEIGALKLVARDLGHAEVGESEEFTQSMTAALKEFREGRSDQTELMRHLATALGGMPEGESLASLLDKWHHHCFVWAAEKTTPLPGALDLLRWLNTEGIPWAIMTNGWCPLQQKKIAHALGSLAPEEGGGRLLVSDQIGAIKPALEAFRLLCRAPGFDGLPPERVYYVEDNPSNCGGATRAGLKAVFYDAEQVKYPEGEPKPAHVAHSHAEVKETLSKALSPAAASSSSSAASALAQATPKL